MANSNETEPNSTVETRDDIPQQAKVCLKNSSPKPSLFCAPGFTLTLSAIALLLALYGLYSNHHSKAQQIETLNQSINNIQQQQEANRVKVDSLKETINDSQLSVQNQMQVLDKNLQTAAQQRLYQKEDWLLLKARYFLELAQINAHWSKDNQTTITLLQQADDLLASTSDQQLFVVRQALAKEISQLQALPQVDIPGLLSQLDAAQGALANLPFKQVVTGSTNNDTADTTKSWQQNLKSSLGNLEKLVIIRHNDEAIQPLLSPFVQTLIRDSIHLNLQEAQWAVMQNNSQVYQLALTRALKELQRIFDGKAVATQALIKQLQNLQQVSLQTASAKPEQSLSLLNQLIEKKNSQPVNNSATPKGGKAP
ncbi:MAG: uroporphyrinogen-III C-methyltransferase [Tatlockia sp.]|nr:uroporphyrinogen-III C-methyltransferase [Tatlockia sp.]